jgi:hypothetical protein
MTLDVDVLSGYGPPGARSTRGHALPELQSIGHVLNLAEPVLLGGVALWGVWLTGRRRRQYTEAKSLGRDARLRMSAGLA